MSGLATLLERHKTGDLTEDELATLSPADREAVLDELMRWVREDMRRNQLAYYEPVSSDARRVHLSTAREIGIQGGNKSGKTGTMLADGVIQLLGVPEAVPPSLRDEYPRAKLRGVPIRGRLVVSSLTSAFDVNLKQKLQWFMWNGPTNTEGLQGDPARGHWGLIPAAWLPGGDWARAWSEKHRVLTLRHPSRGEVWSTLEIMSHDQDIAEFNQGAYDIILEDEIPPEPIHRANLLRVMERGGQIITGGTPPDDRSAAVTVAWFLDNILTPGLQDVDPAACFAVALWTEQNRTLDPQWIKDYTRSLTQDEREARLHGKFLHLAGLIIRGFTEKPKSWCFTCEASTIPVDGGCLTCGARDPLVYCHVWDDEDLTWPGPRAWPGVFYMDPHQARPTACAWFKVDPQDQWWQIGELEVAGDAAEVKRQVLAYERQHHLDVIWRKGDPKITAQHNQFAGEEFTIRRAFQDVGFEFEEANTNFSVGIDRIEAALRPNRWTRAPRLRIHRSCPKTIYQLGHFSWNTGRRDVTDSKEQPSRRHSDFPATVRYMAIDDPEYRSLQMVQHQTRVSLVGAREGRNRATGW